MDILQKIVEYKRKEVEEAKRLYPCVMLEKAIGFSAPTISLKKAVRQPGSTGIIAEFKRKSPSKGMINASATIDETTRGYVKGGAAALSILTDSNFFGGSNEDLIAARKINRCPILRKDFTIDEYQVIEAKAIGADAILLIAAALKPDHVKSLVALAHSVNLEVLLEVHDEEELKMNMDSAADLIGVNNRSLKTFEVSIDTSKRLSKIIPGNVVKISESGIASPQTIIELGEYGFEGFLIGENFMKHGRPEIEASGFISRLRQLRKQKNPG